MIYNKEDIYTGLKGDSLRRVLPFITLEEHKEMIPAIRFDVYLGGYNTKHNEYLQTSLDFSTNDMIQHRMAVTLEWLAKNYYENGAYAYAAGDGLVGFDTILRLADEYVSTSVGAITYAEIAPAVWNPTERLYKNRKKIGRWVLGRTAINNKAMKKNLRKHINSGNNIITGIEIPFGKPSYWLELTRRIIIGQPYYPTDGLDTEETLIREDGKTIVAAVKRKERLKTKSEKFNLSIFRNGECWRFSQLFSLIAKKPTIPVWFEMKDGGDHIFTLCDGWFWDCTGCYLLETLESMGWSILTIVNDKKSDECCNLYRFTHVCDANEKDYQPIVNA